MVCSALVTSSGKISAYKDQELDLFTNSFNTSAAKMCNIKDNHTANSNTDITFWIKPISYDSPYIHAKNIIYWDPAVYILSLKITADQGCSAKPSIKI